MRSAVILLITLLTVGAGFALYLWMEPSHPGAALSPRNATNGPTTAPAAAPANQAMPVSGGDNAYLETYDPKKGYLSRRFRATHYEPQADGTVKVTKPEAEFIAENGQTMRVLGDTGEIVVPSTGTGMEAMSHPGMPTRGKLYNVTLMLLPPSARFPTITCRVPNVTFDNDTFIIQTDSFKDARGRNVAADEVPVSMRGEDYDFDGRGLTIHWDERNRRLARLEIAHGHSLVIKHPKSMGISTTQPAPTPVPHAAAADTTASRSAKRGVSSIHPSPVTEPTADPTTQSTHEGDPYRAEFHDNVRVVQANQELADCELMNVDFLMGSREPATQPATAPTKPAPATRAPIRAPVRTRPAPATVPAPAPAPATQSSEAPMIVLWSGKLIVSPSADDVPHPHGKDAIVEMISTAAQVVARREGSEVRCAMLRLHTEDDSLFLRSSETFPTIHMQDANGTAITSRSFEYNGQSKIALVRGKSHADFQINPESTTQPATKSPATKPAQIAHVDWTQSCTLHMVGADKNQMTVESAVLKGDVRIDHPQMKLNSRELDLSFDPTTQPTKSKQSHDASDVSKNTSLRHMLAKDDVHGRFTDADNPQAPPQTIDCQKLNVDFGKSADGRNFPQLAVADGDVITGDGKSQLHADHLVAKMSPTTAPATQPAGSDMPRVQLQMLDAQQNVRAVSNDGKDIRCDELHMQQKADGPFYRLLSSQSSPARAGDGKNTLIGQIIEFESATQKMRVVGAGAMHGTQQAQTTAAPASDEKKPPSTQPIDVTWENGLDADGKANVVNINGNVLATTKLDDGSVNVVQGSTMKILLSDAPSSTQPTTKKSTTRPVRSDAFAIGGENQNAFHDKIVQTVTIDSTPANAEVRSTLLGADGSLLRRLHLFATTLLYDAPLKKMIVNVPGRMLYEDKRGATTQPTTSPASPQPMQMSMHGSTAFQWQKSFVYDELAHLATMTGDVNVVHRGAAPTDAYQLTAQRVSAEFDSDPNPSGAKDKDDDNSKLKKMTADGDVNFTSQKLLFMAQSVEYDPIAGVLIARGTERQPATLLDATGLSQGTFTELHYDTKSDRLQFVDFHAAIRRMGQ